jgi:hypothetical protein
MNTMYPEIVRHEIARRVRAADNTRRRRLARAATRRSRHGAVTKAC